MKVEGRGWACPSDTGLVGGGIPDPSQEGLPSSQLSSLWHQGGFRVALQKPGEEAESILCLSLSPSLPLCSSLSQPICPPVLLMQEQAWASLGPYCLSLLGPLGPLLTPETPDDNASLEQGDVWNSNSVSEAPGPWGLGCRRLAQLSWSSLCFTVCQPSPPAGPQGQRVTCSEPAAPA